MNRLSKTLLVASLALLFAGIGLAVAQPGSLGDDDGAEAPAADDRGADDADDPDRSDGPDDEVAGGPTSTEAPSATPTSAPTTTSVPTPTSAPTGGSGVGSETGGQSSDDLADTGGTSMIVAGFVLGATGLVVRRRVRTAS